jgi:hypothetical protein
VTPVPFRFDHVEHTYTVNGREIPHVTGMLQKAGKVDPFYYNDRVRERGRAVHSLTAEYDLGALDVSRLVSKYRGYVLAHVAAMQALKPTWVAIEEPEVHSKYLFGTRPDRIGKLYRVLSIVDEKSGVKEKWHPIQTALQAVCVSWRYNLAPEAMPRYALYVSENGRFKLEPHDKRSDIDEAYRVIKACGLPLVA